ncbi:MAG: hypothetical protein AAF515_18015 [Pseudomonadota bacterium]
MVRLEVQALVEVFGAQATVDDIRRRLRCTRCGRRSHNLRVVYRGADGGAAAFRHGGGIRARAARPAPATGTPSRDPGAETTARQDGDAGARMPPETLQTPEEKSD